MDIQINADLLKSLEEVAERQHREVADIIQAALESYLASQERMAKFEADVDRILAEHRWLLDELAKR
jgi:metal-responsive CopG/Arc/MetJ family transcriptional regulator